MKACIKLLTTTLFICLLAARSKAFVLLQDNFSYPDGILTNSTWVAGAGNSLNGGVSVSSGSVIIQETGSSQPRAYFTNGVAGFEVTNQIWAGGAGNSINKGTNGYMFGTNTPVAAIYFSYLLNVTSATNSYHAYFVDTNFAFVARIYASTNTAANGNYRIGIGASTTLVAATNSAGIATNIVQQDLSFGTPYTIVARYIPSTGLQTVWVSPVAETNSASSARASSTFSAPWPNISGFGLRSATGLSSQSGDMTLDNLIIGTTFADVVPSSAGFNPPFIAVQPQSNTSLFVGNNFTNSVLAGGDAGAYQWYFTSNTVTTAISAATNSTLPMLNVQTNQSGSYYVVITNIAGVVTSSVVNIQVFSQPIAPTFSVPAGPVSQTNTVGDTVTLSVTAAGVPPPVLKWFIVTNNITNAVVGGNVSGTNAATLTLTGVNLNQGGVYFASATNIVGKTNSPPITLVVNPIPNVSISALRTMVDASFAPTNTTSLFTIQGIVTTWTNLTTAGNSEFCIQDSSGGITVFWSGAAASTNLPQAGTMMSVTAPLSSFDGLLEVEPVFTNAQHVVKVLSTGNPLPAPQPLPFDPNIVNNNAQMFALGSTYFVASNVTLEASPSTYTFEANEPVTNNNLHIVSAPIFGLSYTNQPGQTFIVFYNENVDFLGQTKPSGPVTIKGVLQYFKSGGAVAPTGWEFTPTRGADIISYINVTNVLSNLTRRGDVPTNSFSQSVLRPGDTLTTLVSIGDPEGGTVTLTPSLTGLPADATWSGLTSGLIGTGTFTFKPTTADQSSNYVVSLNVTSTSGNNFTTKFSVYVPTPQEQQIYISEVFAHPTTNALASGYNPLLRPAPSTETNIPVNDQYIELANLSSSDQTLDFGHLNWSLGNGQSTIHQFNNANSPGVLLANNAYIVYGGLASGQDSIPTVLGGYPNGSIEPIGTGEALSLSTNGGVVTLLNTNGFLVDRVAYPASALNTSFSRFPTLNDGLVPQAYISTNYTTAGTQYDGSPWGTPTKVPAGVTNVTIKVQGPNAIVTFPVNTSQAYTLWGSGSLQTPFSVLFGQGPLATGNNSFTNATSGPIRFYYISTQ
jgi:Immunoglobulin domain/Family of unknown function (DUF5689)